MDKKYYLSLTIFLLLSILTFAKIPNGVIVNQNPDEIIINFNLPEYETKYLTIEEGSFVQLSIEDYGVEPRVGLPALPIVSFNLVFPTKDVIPNLQIFNVETQQTVLDAKVYPFQMPWEKTSDISERPFTIDREYYAGTGDTKYEIAQVSAPFIIHGMVGVTVTIHPFKYNPADDMLTIADRITIKMELPEAEEIQEVSSVMNEFYNGVFANYTPTESTSDVKYVIITAPEYESTLSSFISHKTNLGFDVSVFTTNETGTTSSAIKNYLQGLYDNPLTKPEFVLFVGDVDKIPAISGSGNGSPNTDYIYSLLEGSDYYADVFIGRFSITSTTELENIINKTIYMENYIGTLDKQNCFMASTDNYSISEGTHNYVIDNYFDPNGYTNLKLYTVTYNATTNDLINALNDNQQFAIYSGHGATTYWADGPQLSQAQVSALTNTVYPFVYSFSCITGSYHLSECFGETWIREENAASAFWGSSVNSYWDEDDVLEKEIFQAMFDDGITKITPMFNQGKIGLVNHYGGTIQNGSNIMRYLEMYNLMGDPSLGTQKQIPPDSTPPEPVTDLAVGDVTSNSVTINWTAPYDSTFGGITAYDIRYSTIPITNDNDFNNAPQMMLTGQSDSAGVPKTFVIDGLDFTTDYYLAIKALDIWNNTSDMSNVTVGATFDPPVVSVDQPNLHCNLMPNTTTTDSIILSNNSAANSTLEYSVEMTNNTFPGDAVVRILGMRNETETNSTDKENPDLNNYGSVKGSGGPDLFGYEWIDSNEPNGPAYIWEDISTTGTEVTNWVQTGSFSAKDEGIAGPFALGFEFKFYDNPKTEVFFSTNGMITFATLTSNNFSNYEIPDSDTPNEFIAPFWDDLDGKTNGKVYYKQDGNQFIVQYTNWQKYSGTGTLTFQVVLKSNGRIMFYYENMTTSLTGATVGIENGDGSDGLQIAYNSVFVQNQLAVKIMAEPDWLAMNHTGGMLYNGNSAALVFDFTCVGLEMGDYSMDVVITSNDPSTPELTVPVTMHVGEEVPVELTSFAADVFENVVNLNWITATETNNLGFDIERKSIDSDEWSVVGFVSGQNTTTEVTRYSFTDQLENVGSKNLNYRLKQIDNDGTFEYSDVLEVIALPQQFALEQNYPNPFNPATTIKFALPSDSKVMISIYNSLGQKVSELINEELSAGYHEVDFNGVDLSSGVYYYRMTAGDFVTVKKMMMLK